MGNGIYVIGELTRSQKPRDKLNRSQYKIKGGKGLPREMKLDKKRQKEDD